MRLAATILAFVALATASAQSADPAVRLYHPPTPLLSYEVATIKPIDAKAADGMVKLPPGMSLSPLSVRRYIMNAYGAMYAAQIVGGPDWLNKDAYNIKGKAPDDVEAAFQNLNFSDRGDQTHSMQQSLLADRFHLKAHFETRILPVYELVPAKSGLKITEVPAPPERKPADLPTRMSPGDPLPPGSTMTMLNSNGLRVTNGNAIKMQSLLRVFGGMGNPETGDRPIVDRTGFTGYFDIKDLTWAPLGDASADSAPDAPSLIGAMEKTLGIKLVPAKDHIEVLVIDHIENPSEN
jgi:uncharacterized protein (TIGR03435 family)